MGTITSRPILHNIETALLSVAQVIDTLVRAFEHLISALVSKCISPSIYRHFYVSAPTNVDAVVDMNESDQQGLTRICTEEGVCYVPATRLEQHRAWRKKKEDDRLKRRKMRAEWAAAGLNVEEMARQERRKEREKQRRKDGGKEAESLLSDNEDQREQLSRTSTATEEILAPDIGSSKQKLRKQKPLQVMNNLSHPSVNSKKHSNEKEQDSSSHNKENHWVHTHRTRPLTAVREASHDHGVHFMSNFGQENKGLPHGAEDAFEMRSNLEKPLKKLHKRLNSAPLPAVSNGKSQPVVEAISASRIANNLQQENKTQDNTWNKINHRFHRPTASMPPPMTSTTALRAQTNVLNLPSPALLSPKPRRPMPTNLEPNSPLFSPPFASSSAGISHGPLRTAATPPPAFFNRNRNSIDLSNPISRNGTPSDNDASSIRSKRSITSSTPPPYVIHLADQACKSRWESSAKERKGWKGEVKRIAINKIHEQRTAHRSSVTLTAK